MSKKRMVIVGSCRTPIGKAGATKGNLSSLSACDLVAASFAETLRRVETDNRKLKDIIDQVIVGNVAQSSDSPNVARVALLKAGIPQKTPGFTVQRNCGSGLQALVSACQMIKADEAELILVGGTESMSKIPYIVKEARFGCGLGSKQFVDALWEGLTDPTTGELMGVTGQNVATRYNISRDDQDEFAVRSHQLAFKAIAEGKFRSQIFPIEIGGNKVFKDEGVNPKLKKELLALMPEKYYFVKGGTVHAGNSCGISDGASSFFVMTLEEALSMGIEPEAEILGYAFEACDPSYMGLGPYYAIPSALRSAEISLSDVDYFEINEAFAAQTLACQRELGIPMDKLNVWGGAIALGHPVGATGAILVTKLIALLKDTTKDIGVVSMCIGGGQGGALVVRNWKKGGAL